MKTIRTNSGKEVKIFAETFEYEAYEQIKRLANYEAYQNSIIRIMPDSHAGKGCTVGTTMTITDKKQLLILRALYALNRSIWKELCFLSDLLEEETIL